MGSFLHRLPDTFLLVGPLPGILGACLGFNFPALSYNLLGVTLPRGQAVRGKRRKMKWGFHACFSGQGPGSPPLGIRGLSPHCCCCTSRTAQGWERTQSGGRSTQESKQGISSTSCPAGAPFPPQTRNRGLLFELLLPVCCELRGFSLKDPISKSVKKCEVPRSRPNKTCTEYPQRKL